LKKRILIGLGVVLVVAIVASILLRKDRTDASVETASVSRRDLTAVVNCSGTIQPKRKVDVSANAMGTIIDLAVAEGQMVHKGDLLLKIDPSEYTTAVDALEAGIRSAQADLRLAEASRDKARQDRSRAEELFKEGLNSEEQVITARTNLRIEDARAEATGHRISQLRANLNKARYDLTKVTLTAPMSGIITRLNVEEGENAIMGTLNNPGTVLLVIADLGTMEAWVEVDETEVVKVRLGQPAIIKIDAFPDQEYNGVVTEIGNSPLRVATGASREAVDFEVKITLNDTLPNIRPGLSAKAEIEAAQRPGALAVGLGAVTIREYPLPETGIRHYTGRRARSQKTALAAFGWGEDAADTTASVKRKETEGVFVVVDDFVKFMPVELGIAGEDYFEVLSGLTENQTVVTGPFRVLRSLKDGANITRLKKSTDANKSGD